MNAARIEVRNRVQKIKEQGCGKALIPDWIAYGTSAEPGTQLFLLTEAQAKRIREESPDTAKLIRPYYSDEYFRTGIAKSCILLEGKPEKAALRYLWENLWKDGERKRSSFYVPSALRRARRGRLILPGCLDPEFEIMPMAWVQADSVIGKGLLTIADPSALACCVAASHAFHVWHRAFSRRDEEGRLHYTMLYRCFENCPNPGLAPALAEELTGKLKRFHMETIRAIREARLAGKPFTRYEDFASRETAACLQQVNEAVNAGYGADCQPAGGDSGAFREQLLWKLLEVHECQRQQAERSKPI